MSVEQRRQGYSRIFNNWKLNEKIGTGTDGRTIVFKMVRNIEEWQTVEENCVVKIISVVEEEGRYHDLSDKDKSKYEERKKALCIIAEEELKYMNRLKDSVNVVHYLDYRFEDWSLDFSYGCDLLIRMEMLDVLRNIIKNNKLIDSEVIHLGKNICSALVVCHEQGIIHRDIKPENIFCNSNGIYKLGDFGISRATDSIDKLHIKAITTEYAAPEQFLSDYGSNTENEQLADIYSLGMVLYELSNNNRLPFAKNQYLSVEELELRIKGEPFCRPLGCNQQLADIIMKACEYNPKDRYQSAHEFYAALDKIDTKEITEVECKKNEMETNFILFDKVSKILNALHNSTLNEFMEMYSFDNVKSALNCYSDIPVFEPGFKNKQEIDEFIATAQTLIEENEKIVFSIYRYCTVIKNSKIKYDKQGVEKVSFLKEINSVIILTESSFIVLQSDYNYWKISLDRIIGAEFKSRIKKNIEYNVVRITGKEHSIIIPDYFSMSHSEIAFSEQEKAGNGMYNFSYEIMFQILKKLNKRDENDDKKCENENLNQNKESLANEFSFLVMKKKMDSESILIIKSLAERGFSEAQLILGQLFEEGKYFDLDIEKALYWYEQAAIQENSTAQFDLGRIFLEGKITEKDNDNALKWLNRSASNGNAYAQNWLAHLYENGEVVMQDIKKTIDFYEAAAFQGLANAQLALGDLFSEGDIIEADKFKSMYWYEQAALQGDYDAQLRLAQKYMFEGSFEHAIFWYEKSLEQKEECEKR